MTESDDPAFFAERWAPDQFIYTRDDVLRMLDALLDSGGSAWWGEFYTDQQVYERAGLGGGLGYTADRLRALWDAPPFSVRVLRQMKKSAAQEARFGADFLWVLLATKANG